MRHCLPPEFTIVIYFYFYFYLYFYFYFYFCVLNKTVFLRFGWQQNHSTVTLFARLRGLSTSVPRAQAVW